MEIKTPQEGLQVLVNAVKVAVKRGAYELEEVETILLAIKTLSPKNQEVAEEKKDKE